MRKKVLRVTCSFLVISALILLIMAGCAPLGAVIVNNHRAESVNVVFAQGSQDLSFTLGSGASKVSQIIADSYSVTVTKTSDGSLVVSWGYVYVGANTTQTLDIN